MRRKWMVSVLSAAVLAAMSTGCGGTKDKADGAEEVLTEALNQEEIALIAGNQENAQQKGAQSGELGQGEGQQEEEQPENEADGDAKEGEKDSSALSDAVKTGLEDADGKLFESAEKQTADLTTADHMVGERELPIYCVDTPEKKIGLSFDAAWGNSDTGQILEILENHNVHVTFFMTGDWVENYPDDVKNILAAGHDLGNHSENHKNMSQLPDEEKQQELMKVHTKVKDLTGYDMFLFRPPYGDYDNAVIEVAKSCGYYPIQWDVDSLDWQNKGVEDILKTVTEHKNLGNGSIVLCHNGADYTAEALDRLLTMLKEQGYEVVPISELIYRENYHLNHEGRQIKN